MAGPFVLIRSTYGDETAARAAARRLVTNGRACCAHVTPIDSIYVWEGKLVEEGEWMLEARVLAERAGEATRAVAHDHPYDEPLIESITVDWAAPGYIDWARKSAPAP